MKTMTATAALALLLSASAAIAQSPPPYAPPAPPAPTAAPNEAEPPLPGDDPGMAAQQLPQETTPPPAEAVAPTRPATMATFDQGLSPYGRWVNTPEYGRVWQPASVSADWQPYTDGRWVYTTAGWSFASSVPWGWATYHYGRWGWGAGLGWYWVPGTVWGPAWVSWRTSGTHVAWAPLAPRGYVYPRGWYGWSALRAGDMTYSIRTRMVPRASAVVVLRGARPGWGYAPAHIRPGYRRAYGRPVVIEKRHGRRRW